MALLLGLVGAGVLFRHDPKPVFIQAGFFFGLYALGAGGLLWRWHTVPRLLVYLVVPYVVALLAYALMGLVFVGAFLVPTSPGELLYPYLVSGLWGPGLVAWLTDRLSASYTRKRTMLKPI